MRLLSVAGVFVLALFVAACTDEVLPTASVGLEDTQPVFAKAAQGDRSEWEVFEGWGGTITQGQFPTGYLPCMGEDAWFVGSYQWYKKETVTPSGNVQLNLMYRLGEDVPGGVPVALVGMDSGTVWPLYRYNSHFFMHTKKSDGLTYFVQPDQTWHVNEATGERIKAFYLWKTVWDADFNVVSDDSKLAACVKMGG